MAGSYPARPRSRTPFLITTYVPRADGELIVEMPRCCPHAVAGERCELSVHHVRQRKTGPVHPLTVAQCSAHKAAFTLYPPGYAPYLRQPVQRLSPDDREVAAESRDPQQGNEWRRTLFEAAVDAKDGHAWPRTAAAGTVAERWWGPQGRYLQRAASLVGVAGDLADSVREAIGATLSVGTLVLGPA